MFKKKSIDFEIEKTTLGENFSPHYKIPPTITIKTIIFIIWR
jgi:hypothetical protein